MKVKELYDHIVSQMTPEEALMKLLEGSVINYEYLKFDKGQNKEVHPIFIITMAAMELGWQFAINNKDENVNGLVVGTAEYMEDVFPTTK